MNQKVVLASSNQGKLAEMQTLLADAGFEVLSQDQFSIAPVDETGLSFVENAILKARNACVHTGLPAIADDSGLEVDALHGQPGIYSARFCLDGHDDQDAANNVKLLNSLEGLTQADRSARFRCVLVYMRHHEDPCPIICLGTWEGRILHQPAGDSGFGYDPLFYVPEKNCSSAELSRDEKNRLSHRGKALRELLKQLSAESVNTPPLAE